MSGVKEKAMTTIDKPLPIDIKPPILPPDTYREVCERIGFRPAANSYPEFEGYCFHEEIPLYDLVQVYKYLNQKRKADETIMWVPLREKDSGLWYCFSNSPGIEGRFVLWSNTKGVSYTMQVPERVLLLVEKIEKQFPDAQFYVSNIVSNPDPFMGVKFPGGMKLFIFAVWDEPGFSG